MAKVEVGIDLHALKGPSTQIRGTYLRPRLLVPWALRPSHPAHRLHMPMTPATPQALRPSHPARGSI